MHRRCYTFLNITEFLLIFNHVNQAQVVIVNIQLRVGLRLGPAALHPSLHRSQDTVPPQTLHPLLAKVSQTQIWCCPHGAACTAASSLPLLQHWAQPWWTGKLLPQRQPSLTAQPQSAEQPLSESSWQFILKKKKKKSSETKAEPKCKYFMAV